MWSTSPGEQQFQIGSRVIAVLLRNRFTLFGQADGSPRIRGKAPKSGAWTGTPADRSSAAMEELDLDPASFLPAPIAFEPAAAPTGWREMPASLLESNTHHHLLPKSARSASPAPPGRSASPGSRAVQERHGGCPDPAPGRPRSRAAAPPAGGRQRPSGNRRSSPASRQHVDQGKSDTWRVMLTIQASQAVGAVAGEVFGENPVAPTTASASVPADDRVQKRARERSSCSRNRSRSRPAIPPTETRRVRRPTAVVSGRGRGTLNSAGHPVGRDENRRRPQRAGRAARHGRRVGPPRRQRAIRGAR